MHPLVGCTRRALVRCDDPALTRVLGAVEGVVRTLEKRHRVILGAQLCDAGGRNQSSAATTLTALGVTLVSTGDTGLAEDPGNANPDSAFRYDPALDGAGGYIFNLKTTGYQMGTYNLRFRAGNDPTVHVAEFRVR